MCYYYLPVMKLQALPAGHWEVSRLQREACLGEGRAQLLLFEFGARDARGIL